MYSYMAERDKVFTERGQRMFLDMRDFVQKALKECGAVRMQEAMGHSGGGDSWAMLACIDRMVELKEIREITRDVAGQDRVFVSARG